MSADDATNRQGGIRKYVPLRRAWQRYLLMIEIALAMVSFPFLGALLASTTKYPNAGKILPFANLVLALPLFVLIVSEVEPRWRSAGVFDRYWACYLIFIAAECIGVIYDSLAHILGVINPPTFDSLALPWLSPSLRLDIAYMPIVLGYVIPLAIAALRRNRS